MNKTEYVPFGAEWEKAMMELTKKEIVALYKKTCLQYQEEMEGKKQMVQFYEDGRRGV